MDNLAFAATMSNNILGQLMENNTKLTSQLVNAMKLSVSTGAVMGGGDSSPRNTCRNHRKKIDYDKTDHQMDPEGYCWLRGYRVPKNHNSMNCDKQKPGHQLGATRANIMGGSRHHH
eukprot:10115425-Ditylum_brightwellii.AAC.1